MRETKLNDSLNSALIERDLFLNFILVCSSGHSDSDEALWGTSPAGGDTQCRLLVEGVGFRWRGLSITIPPQQLETSRQQDVHL